MLKKPELITDERFATTPIRAANYAEIRPYVEECSTTVTVEEGVITNNTSREAIPRIMVFSGMDGAEIVRKIERVAENTFAAERGH